MRRKLAVAALISGVLSVGSCGGKTGGDGGVHVSPSGSDSAPCTGADPCRTFVRAYAVAEPGEIVHVAGGTYPAQRLDRDLSKPSREHVRFLPAPGADVTIATGVSLGSAADDTKGAAHVTLERLRVDGTISAYDTTDLVWKDIHAKNFYVSGVRDVVIRGGIFGPCRSSIEGCSNSKVDVSTASQLNDNVLVEDAVFHDYRIGRKGDHFECMFLRGGTNITIRRNKFYNCDLYDIFVQHAGQSLAGLTIENNWFDAPFDGQGGRNRMTAIEFSPRGQSFRDVLVRYNSFFDAAISVNGDGDGTRYHDFRIIGNIARSSWSSCYASVVYRYNVWSNETCGDTDRTLAGRPLPYANPVSGKDGDYRLVGGVAVDLVPGTSADERVRDDIAGTARPVGRAWDAGSHELAE